MSTRALRSLPGLVILGCISVAICGCTSLEEYVHNGFKVGPNYKEPPAPVAKQWIDANDQRVRSTTDDLSKWWKVFNDPILDALICDAYRQNLSLRAAGFRVLEARAQLNISMGELFPQQQQMVGDHTRTALSTEVANRNLPSLGGTLTRWYPQWDYGFNLSWELDFWGRFRRAVESNAATLDASVFSYDDVLVTLLGDVATNYINYRTTQLRIKYAEDNVKIQGDTLKIVQDRRKVGVVTDLDLVQARSVLEQTEATIPELQIALRQTGNALCILLGIPPEDLDKRLGQGPIPTTPVDVAVGVPADLLRRRPDVRVAERKAAAQCAQIGVAESDFYPHIFISGTLEYSGEQFNQLFNSKAFGGTFFGPGFTWNILNYGRILNNVRFQDATFQELVATYQNTVLSAAQDVENGLVTFLRAQKRTKLQTASVDDGETAVKIALQQYNAGTTDFTRVTQVQQNLVLLQDTLAQAQGEIGTGLVQVYRALGGGWQIRCTGCDPQGTPAPAAAPETTAPPPRPLPKTPAPAPVPDNTAPAPLPSASTPALPSAAELRAVRFGTPVPKANP
jgi:NodT family efflux transporter outer membrane factor (OMF) lipoprotein